MSNAEWRMANGECRMANGEWRMANAEWRRLIRSGDHGSTPRAFGSVLGRTRNPDFLSPGLL
jgi:hypothetical protein